MTKHDRILKYVNRIRKVQNKKPLKKLPKGKPVDMCNCPVAKAIGMKSGTVIIYCQDVELSVKLEHSLRLWRNPTSNYVRHPQYVQEWIERFDDRLYPELIK